MAMLRAQAASALGKAEDLIRWSLDLRSLQLPRLPASVHRPPLPAAQPLVAQEAAAARSGAGFAAAEQAAPGGADGGVLGAHDCSASDAAGASADRCSLSSIALSSAHGLCRNPEEHQLCNR